MTFQKIDIAKDKNTLLGLAVVLILFAVFGRLLPHPPNFAPVSAVAIFGGVILPKRLAISLPLLAMVISDLVIGLHPLILFTWGSFAVIALLSGFFSKGVKPIGIISLSLASSMLFYLVSNFGVWLQGKMYPMNIWGLMNCYYKAIPFFRNTLLGDLTFTAILFGLYAFAVKLVNLKQGVSITGNQEV